MASKSSYFIYIKWSKTWIVWLDLTWLVIVIIVQNIGIQLEVESNNSGSFFIGSYTNIFRSREFLSNSEARSSYLPNLVNYDCSWVIDLDIDVFLFYHFSSIARTNLEIDIVQRGGSLVVETRGASALPSFSTQTSHTNKPKFCFGEILFLLFDSSSLALWYSCYKSVTRYCSFF